MIMVLKTTNSSLFGFALGTVVTLIACGEPTARVSIDLQALVDRAALTADRLDQVRVAVSAASTVPTEDRRKEIELDVSERELTFEFELGPGRWLFEIVGAETDSSGSPNATYFGDLVVDLAPHSEVDIVIPVFPAGTLVVPIWIAKETEIVDAVVSFVPRVPRVGQSEIYRSRLIRPAQEGSAPATVDAYDVERILPTGDYDAFVDASVDGATYLPAEGEPIPIIGATPDQLAIEQGVVNQWGVPFDIY